MSPLQNTHTHTHTVLQILQKYLMIWTHFQGFEFKLNRFNSKSTSEICFVIIFIFKIRKLKFRDITKCSEDYTAIERWDFRLVTTPWCLHPPPFSHGFLLSWIVVLNHWESCRSIHQKGARYCTQILYWLWVLYIFKIHLLRFKEPRLILGQCGIFFSCWYYIDDRNTNIWTIYSWAFKDFIVLLIKE